MKHTCRLGLWLLALLFGISSGCGTETVYVECPPGKVPQGSLCVDPKPDTGVPDPGIIADKDTGPALPDFPIAPEDVPADPGPANPDPGPGNDADPIPDPGQVSPDPGGGPAQVGSHCMKKADCPDGGECLNWPQGYCAIMDCVATGCPAGSACVMMLSGNSACLATCSEDSDCLADGTQGCKHLPLPEGLDTVGVCHGVTEDAGVVGATCEDDAQCIGAGTCLASMPGGYCAEVGCEEDGCPLGAACVKFDGEHTCLRDCTSDADCGGSPGAERQCAELKSVDKQLVPVCVSGVDGLDIGQPCQSGFECSSGFCEILGDGRCSLSDLPCFDQEDCTIAEFCNILPGSKAGICSAICAVGTACPGVSFCAGTPGEADGVCRVPCSGPGDMSCNAQNGFSCGYGYPLGATTGQGTYLCHVLGAGGMGASCEDGGDCDSADCAVPAGGEAGVCLEQCSFDLYCPFPGTCVSTRTALTCHKACMSVVDCPAGAVCDVPQGSTRKVCL